MDPAAVGPVGAALVLDLQDPLVEFQPALRRTGALELVAKVGEAPVSVGLLQVGEQRAQGLRGIGKHERIVRWTAAIGQEARQGARTWNDRGSSRGDVGAELLAGDALGPRQGGASTSSPGRCSDKAYMSSVKHRSARCTFRPSGPETWLSACAMSMLAGGAAQAGGSFDLRPRNGVV